MIYLFIFLQFCFLRVEFFVRFVNCNVFSQNQGISTTTKKTLVRYLTFLYDNQNRTKCVTQTSKQGTFLFPLCKFTLYLSAMEQKYFHTSATMGLNICAQSTSLGRFNLYYCCCNCYSHTRCNMWSLKNVLLETCVTTSVVAAALFCCYELIESTQLQHNHI